VLDVAVIDNIRVGQIATSEYAIHQYKDFASLASKCTIEWYGRTNCDTSLSATYLQIYNRDTTEWETIDSDNSTAEDTNFTLTAEILDLTNYKDVSNVSSCRVWQLDI